MYYIMTRFGPELEIHDDAICTKWFKTVDEAREFGRKTYRSGASYHILKGGVKYQERLGYYYHPTAFSMACHN